MKFPTIRIEGNVLSQEILDKIEIAEGDRQQPHTFGLDNGKKVKDEIAATWADLQDIWRMFKRKCEGLRESDTGTAEVRRFWIVPLLNLLGYEAQLENAEIVNGQTYAISHRDKNLNGFPIQVVGFKDKEHEAPECRSTLDIKPSNATRRMSPHALVQEYINLTEHVYAIVSNGLQLRLLRDSSRLTKLSYVEFDLERMMEEEVYADFAVLFRLMHVTRMPVHPEKTNESLIEQYHEDALDSGSRIRDGLSAAVKKSIERFANGFLNHPANIVLRDSIESRTLEYYNFFQCQLRLIYRLLFLMVIEERDLIFPADADPAMKKLYYQYYSLNRLRKLAEKVHLRDAKHCDHFTSLLQIFRLFESGKHGKALGIKPLGGDLFSHSALGIIFSCQLDNKTLMECLYDLSIFRHKETGQRIKVNYASLNVEEFGSVYEGLLEYKADIRSNLNQQLEFRLVKGTERSSSGSHYTPDELVQPLIKHSLEYLIEDKLKQSDPVNALLTIKVCDVACGSGHILLNAARRIAIEVARKKYSEEQPSPGHMRWALREVIKISIYGVDKNPLAVELCKVALWLEAHNPGEPLNFLDHHIKCGDAIVGLVKRTELDNGILNNAFKAMPGDDKEIAGLLLKKNKAEYEQSKTDYAEQLTTEYDEAFKEKLEEYKIAYDIWLNMPEHTADETAERQLAYCGLQEHPGHAIEQLLANAQVAQFFIPKTTAYKDLLLTHGEYMKIRHGYKGFNAQAKTELNAIASSKRFFHWFLEFPEVDKQGGFDCILGNPPYLGGTLISGNNSKAYFNFITSNFPLASNRCDLAGYFLRRIFSLIGMSKGFAIITTNTISEGDTRTGGIEKVMESGGIINYAAKSTPWPGKAAVVVSVISVFKKRAFNLVNLYNKPVKFINSFLDDGKQEANPAALLINENIGYNGSYIFGDGFLLDHEEVNRLIKVSDLNKSVLQPYLNGSDLNSSPTFQGSRWVINFGEMSLAEASKYPECLAILESRVKEFRQSKSVEVANAPWWQFWRVRRNLYDKINALERVLVHTRVTKTHGFAFVPVNQVFSDATVVIADDKASTFSFLQSSLHEAWAWKYSSRLKSDRRYSVEDCFQTFPFPIEKDSLQLEEIGEQYHEARRQLMIEISLGLTKTYNIFHSKALRTILPGEENIDDDAFEKLMGKEALYLRKHLLQPLSTTSFNSTVQNIYNLRRLQMLMDNVVLGAYNWGDIPLQHDFYEVDYLPGNDCVRYTIHPNARKEVLQRLLELNQQFHSAENVVAEATKAGGRKQPKPIAIGNAEMQLSLLPNLENIMKPININSGIYSVPDVAYILNIDRPAINKLFNNLFDAKYECISQDKYSVKKLLRVSFYGLIEIAVIVDLRKNRIPLGEILKARQWLKGKFNHLYPFATYDIISTILKAGNKIIFDENGNLLSLGGSNQLNFSFITEFCKKIDFDSNGLVSRLYPVLNSKLIIMDPNFGGGRPCTAEGEIWVEMIKSTYKDNGSIEVTSKQWNISEQVVIDAISFETLNLS